MANIDSEYVTYDKTTNTIKCGHCHVDVPANTVDITNHYTSVNCGSYLRQRYECEDDIVGAIKNMVLIVLPHITTLPQKEIEQLLKDAKRYLKLRGGFNVNWIFEFTRNQNYSDEQIKVFVRHVKEELQIMKNKETNKEAKEGELIEEVIPEDAAFFQDQYEDPCAAIPIDGHREIYPVNGSGFRGLVISWLAKKGKVPSHDRISSIKNYAEGQAHINKNKIPLYNRVAKVDSTIYVDLCDKDWRTLKISKDGAEICSDYPIIFKRYRHQQEIIVDLSGTKEDLETYISMFLHDDENKKILVSGYLGALFNPNIPRPIFMSIGLFGTAKSTFCKHIRMIIDPSQTPLLKMNKDEGELAQLLNHNYAPFFDNVSGISQNLADMLCRASTGEGINKRTLYSDDEDRIFKYRRAVGINSINIPSSAPDLLDRALTIEPPEITEEKRLSEEDVEKTLNELRPKVVGYIAKSLVEAEKIKDQVKSEITKLQRMADFMIYGEAVCRAMGYKKMKFYEVYTKLTETSNSTFIDNDLVAELIRDIANDIDDEKGEEWKWSALYNKMKEMVTTRGGDLRSQDWPKSQQALGRRLNTIAPNLKKIGIQVIRETRTDNKKFIIIRRTKKDVSDTGSSITTPLKEDDWSGG